MPIPFHNLIQDEPSGVAAYLRFVDEPEGKGIRGALLVASSRGDPLEFSFTRVDVRSGVLWHDGQAKARAISALAKALFEVANHKPDLLLALADETPAKVFSEELGVQIPMCRVAAQGAGMAAPTEAGQQLSESLYLYWVNGRPLDDAECARLVETLGARRLLLEPFDRAALGIQEAFDG